MPPSPYMLLKKANGHLLTAIAIFNTALSTNLGPAQRKMNGETQWTSKKSFGVKPTPSKRTIVSKDVK